MDQKTDPRIYSDLTRVDEAIPGEDIRQRILNFTATTEEITDWFYKDDPLAESRSTRAIKNIAGKFEKTDEGYEQLKEDILGRRRTATYEHAAITLLGSVYTPDATTDVSGGWFNNYCAANIESIRKIPGQIPESGVFHLLTSNKPAQPLTGDGLQKLLIAIDCFGYSASSYMHMHEVLKDIPSNLLDTFTADTAAEKFKAYSQIAHEIADVVMQNSLAEIESESQVEKDERLEAGVRAGLWRWFNMYDLNLAVIDTINDDVDRNEIFTTIIGLTFSQVPNLLRAHFLKESESEEKVIKGSKKGILHEALWLLDTNFLLLNSDITKGRAIPTSLKSDKPLINRPELNRGFDVHIVVPTTRSVSPLRSMRVQLKASKGKNRKGEYHPTIHVVEEENFMDTDKRRLAKKLHLYEQWVATGFDETVRDQIMGLVLGSSKSFIPVIKEVQQMSDLEYTLYKQPGLAKNRAEIRRLARVLGRVVSK